MSCQSHNLEGKTVTAESAERVCKIRKRGCSSSSSSSLVRRYRFKRAILVGKRGGSSTPFPTWKTSARSPSLAMENAEFPKVPTTSSKGKQVSLSARKLAATLWEINEVPSASLQVVKNKNHNNSNIEKQFSSTETVPKLSYPFSDPCHSSISNSEPEVGFISFTFSFLRFKIGHSCFSKSHHKFLDRLTDVVADCDWCTTKVT